MDDQVVVSLSHVTKRFPGVAALSDVSFDLRHGEVHVLVGENGAGKSTLINILGGIVQPDQGTITVRGKEFKALTPALSQELGIGIIHQELAVVPQLSVAENVFLGRLPKRGALRIDWKELNAQAEQSLKSFGVDIDPTVAVGKLSVALQQVVEITKVLALKGDVIVMDEPTSALTSREVQELFRIVEELKRRGVSIIYISHRLEEVKRLGDRMTVLKDGRVVGTRNVAEVEIDEIVRMMVGREVKRTRRDGSQRALGAEVLRVEGLSTPSKVKNVSFTVRAGEIVGFAGIVGAGRTEIVRAIFGAEAGATGRVWISGKPVEIRLPLAAIKSGIALIPEDRRCEGLILGFPVRTNISLPRLQKSGQWLIKRKTEREQAEEARRQLGIKTPHVEQAVGLLSGGNQQKVVVGKWLHVDAKVLIFDEPTRGVDVGAKAEIQELIKRFAAEGKAVLIVSSELPELLSVCDRILVIFDGRVVNELNGAEATEEDIVYSATTGLRRTR
ncbi:MAG TPA: sugar ABC transporter ATP-binding protein [Firmicutes bacterium]|nr:sugar ABC transporter ATP-binding protein [Bacillota bacterium]